MEFIVKELGFNSKNIFPTVSTDLCAVVVHNTWLKKWLKNLEVDNSVNSVDFTLQPGESVPYPFRKIFIRVLNKKASKVLPLPRYKLNDGTTELPLTFSQLLQYVSQNNQRNLWKESYKKYCQNDSNSKESTIVNLLEHDQLLSEVLFRLYGCNIIRIKHDSSGKLVEYKEIAPNKYVSKSYETHVNLLSALFILETDNNYFVIYGGHYEHSLLDCLNFSPHLVDMNYGRGLFLTYQLLHMAKATGDRGLSLGNLTLQDIYLTENLWLQILPLVTNNIHCLDASLIHENKSKQTTPVVAGKSQSQAKKEEWCWRNDAVQLEKLCMLWVRGRISNLDYLLHLNALAGRSADDPQAHFMVPWVTDFASRCGRNWRDLSKSKYRLNKGDRQLDMTYDVGSCSEQIPHHVSDALTDITCYVYLARRTQKEVLCKYVRNKWVPAEYPASIQRMQEWTPDECIPEFYTDPTVFKSIHEDLPDLGIPSWATCAEDFITKHREALESTHVSENLHHWIDITFGYKLSGAASIKAKNVCLSLVDGHTVPRKGAMAQLLAAPHPPRTPRPLPPQPPRLHWTAPRDSRKSIKPESSEEISDEEEESTSLPQHVSRLSVPPQRVRSRYKSGSRARSLSKTQGHEDSQASTEARASSHSRHYRVQRSELGKGVIYLPKEFNPVASIQALEALDNFRTKCFFSKAEDKEKSKETVTALNHFPMQQEVRKTPNVSVSSIDGSDDTAFTNHMFLASYDQNYLKKFSQDAHLENVLKERKNRSLNPRYTTDAAIYKQFVTESRRQDMLVIGCLIVEIFLHQYIRPLRSTSNNFMERYNNCRTVLKYNFSTLPKCVTYVASLLLNVQPPSLSFKNELLPKEEPLKKIVVTDKGLPPPTASQLLQPLLMQHLIPFPQSFNTLYKLLSTLHEYELTSNELNILYMYECDGIQCEKYQNVDKTKLYFSQRIAEGKIQACASHLDVLLCQINSYSQFDVLDIFLTHYIELLKNRDTSVLAAWYLFDTVSKALGPEATKKKLLKHILNLYEDDDLMMEKSEHKLTDIDSGSSSTGSSGKQKFVKLYHNIFLLQLMVRLGLQCFLDNFTQHLVEAVGGYKDDSTEAVSPGHICHNRLTINKKPRYSDDNVKNALSTTTDIFSPDTSYGSEHVATPSVEKSVVEVSEVLKEKDSDTRSENELFHFETDKERLPSRNSRSKSPAESIDSCNSNPAHESTVHTPSPSTEYSSPASKQYFTSSANSKDVSVVITENEEIQDTPKKAPMSPTIDIPSKPMFTSYLHFAEEDSRIDDLEVRKDSNARQVKSLEFNRNLEVFPASTSRSFNDVECSEAYKDSTPCKISDMSSESLIWLAHRLGPVLTCRYITRNLLKMLTLCYIGKDNLTLCEGDERDEFDEISVINSRVVGDRNAMKVIKCLTAIVAMYGEQLIIFQYLPHMGELIASCRRRLSAPLEGGVVACLQLVKYLLPYMSDVKVMEQLLDTFLKSILQPALRLASTSRSSYPSGAAARGALARKLLGALHALALRVGQRRPVLETSLTPLLDRSAYRPIRFQDTFLKSILQPALRLASTSRSSYPSGAAARGALARKLLGALHALALRVGPEMTRRHLCVHAVQRFFLAFDKATGKTENWPKQDEVNADKPPEDSSEARSEGFLELISFKLHCSYPPEDSAEARSEGFLELCRDGSTVEWTVREGRVQRADLPDLACTPPAPCDRIPDPAVLTAQEELLMVFDDELAYKAYTTFSKFVGTDAMERCLKNSDTIRALCRKYEQSHYISSPLISRPEKRVQTSFSDEPISRKSIDITPTKPDLVMDHMSSSNSFGSNVTLVGNRIDVATEASAGAAGVGHGFDVVACKMDNGIKSNSPVDITPTKPDLVMDHMSSSNSFGSNVTLVGNRIDVATEASAGAAGVGHGFDVVACKMDNGIKSNRHLRGDWLIYWEHEIGRPDKDTRFNLKQIKLQTFAGHAAAVKSLHALDNEHSFMSGSKDKCVRLWSLRNQGDGNATTQCNWTYTGHKKGVLSLAFLDSLRLAVSTDSVVHIWDPFMESVVSQLDNIKSPVSIVRTLGDASATVLAATTDATLKFIDARACNYTHDLKLPMSTTTLVRCLCVCAAGGWAACGLASGHVAVLDLRAGHARAHWRAHDGEVLRLAVVDEHRLLSSGLDQVTALWRPDDGELIAHLKGSTEPVHCLSVYYNELISGTTNNRIGVHTSLDQEASFSSTKLRSDTFKGVLTCMAVLPLNRLLLLGSDNGTISLLC
ncbi:WD repeat-containing protein 81 [Ostrinia nubilalis]|uniref:WD repeat-containing protein 81 n=1 Tax=Ostrinia nubilalis TaxID=29057 RepID=UPI0030826299